MMSEAFKEKYSMKANELNQEGKEKIVISSDSYAVCEMLQNVINALWRGK